MKDCTGAIDIGYDIYILGLITGIVVLVCSLIMIAVIGFKMYKHSKLADLNSSRSIDTPRRQSFFSKKPKK